VEETEAMGQSKNAEGRTELRDITGVLISPYPDQEGNKLQ